MHQPNINHINQVEKQQNSPKMADIQSVNPLAAKDEYTRSETLIFLWPWTPRRSAIHTPGSGLISTDVKKNSKIHQKWLASKVYKKCLKRYTQSIIMVVETKKTYASDIDDTP